MRNQLLPRFLIYFYFKLTETNPVNNNGGHINNQSSIERLRNPQMVSINEISLTEEEKKRQSDLLRIYKLKKLAKSVSVPTNDKEVKYRLRELNHPICYFGEKAFDRRERLKKILTNKVLTEGKIPTFTKKIEKTEENRVLDNEIFYTEGSLELKQIRLLVAKYSIPKSAFRLAVTKKKFMEIDRIQESLDYEKYLKKMKNFEFSSSQFADERGCARGRLSPNNELYGVAGWSGTCSVYSI
jgi:U4/U6 small nuclear ribonucleoprotein PRP4